MDNLWFPLLNEILIAILGGVFTITTTTLGKKFKRWRLEKKYPISGSYISTFEDEADGKKVVKKAPVSLKQNGLHVDGTTVLGDRTWILNGDISTDGYLHGVYHAESVRDKGVGNFFLEISINGDMVGLWSGYDSVNKKIQSGKYSFLKKPKIEISSIKQNQVPMVLSIAEKQLGEAYIDVDGLLNKENIAIAASVSGKLLGFCTGKKIAVSDLYNKIPQLAQMKLKQLEVVDEVGMVASMATDSESTGRGVGSELLEACVSELEKSGLNVLVMTGWKSDKGVHVGSLAKQYGFKEILEVPNFWYEDSKVQDYKCPSCGDPPCECSAVIFIKHVQK